MLDTNTLVSGMGWSGAPARIVDAVLAGELLLVSSPPLLAELARVLEYPKLARVSPDPAAIVERIAVVAELVEPVPTLAVVPDEPDNRVLEAAVEARVDAIVTGGALVLEDAGEHISANDPGDFEMEMLHGPSSTSSWSLPPLSTDDRARPSVVRSRMSTPAEASST